MSHLLRVSACLPILFMAISLRSVQWSIVCPPPVPPTEVGSEKEQEEAKADRWEEDRVGFPEKVVPAENVRPEGQDEEANANRLTSALPLLMLVKKKSPRLGFDAVKVGPSGLGSVDVYVTTDEGATWLKSSSDHSVTLPVSAETHGVAPQKGIVTVHLLHEGVVYGFYLVVKSRAGLAKSGPKSGYRPQVRLEVDTTQPLAELYVPQPEGKLADSLLLTWKAEDRNLAEDPITLEWSGDGKKWHSIGARKLPNTGRFVWKIPAKLPPKVHLKLTARDRVGNVAVAQTSEMVRIDLAEPELGEVYLLD